VGVRDEPLAARSRPTGDARQGPDPFDTYSGVYLPNAAWTASDVQFGKAAAKPGTEADTRLKTD
jgi:hypothetical protein